jgi:hypothetical protein
MKDFSQDSWCCGRDSNQALSEYMFKPWMIRATNLAEFTSLFSYLLMHALAHFVTSLNFVFNHLKPSGYYMYHLL